MQQSTHVWPETPTRSDGLLECGARIELPGLPPQTLWYRVPEAHGDWLTESADPFLIGALFLAMRRRGDLRIHGSVSPSLLRNLEEFQEVWSEWWPDRYQPLAIHADNEREEKPADSGQAALTFSGGLDSSFSAWRHTRGDAGRARVALGAAVMAHGFDIPLSEPETFARAAGNSARLVGSLGVDLVTVATNARDIVEDWPETTHGAALASCLHLLRRGFSTGLIASSHTYGTLRFPWGSNPVTDPLLSTEGFPISYDGAAFSRREKARAVAAWPEAMECLRVCWEGERKDRNCGVCVRCVGTALSFAIEGLPVPPSLRIDSLEEAVRGLRGRPMKPVAVLRLSEIAREARSAGNDAPWVGALEWSVRYQRLVGVRHAIATRLRELLGVETNGRMPWRELPTPAPERPAGEPFPRRLPVRALYREIDDEVDRGLGIDMGFGQLLRAAPYPMDEATVRGFRHRYAVIKRFQQRTLELFQASLRGDVAPEIACMVVGEMPEGLGHAYHRELTAAQHRTPVFFRTDELRPGRLAEVQCCGSAWGIVEQIRALYDANTRVFGDPEFFPQTLAQQFATALRRYLGTEPIVHHLVDNSSRPDDTRYFIQRLRGQGVRHFSYDGSVKPEDCTFVRSHDFITLPHHNFFADRMERCKRGEVFFDLPPSCLFDGKVIQAWPFWEVTRDWYDDEVRALFPHTAVVGPEGLVLADGQGVSIEEFCRLPAGERQYYVKYAGTDIATNWGSRAVFLASTFSRDRCRELMESVLADRARQRHWILQEAVRHSEPVTALDREGGTVDSTAYVKYCGFYGPDGLMAVHVLHRRSHKVHGSPDTIVSLVR